jgi:hypothetical protein
VFDLGSIKIDNFEFHAKSLSYQRGTSSLIKTKEILKESNYHGLHGGHGEKRGEISA